jgi:hypothetical protein
MKWISPEVWVGFMAGTASWLVWAILNDHGWLNSLKEWQTLAGAFVASIAIVVTIVNARNSLSHAEKLEVRKRAQKLAAIRAILPHTLDEISTYARSSARTLDRIFTEHQGNLLPAHAIKSIMFKAPPKEALQALTEFIEYADTINVEVIEATVAWMQIHAARVRELCENSQDPERPILRVNLIHRILDAGAIFAGAASVFDYARRRSNVIPTTVPWDYVQNCLHTMGLFNNDYETEIERSAALSSGPFDVLNARQ